VEAALREVSVTERLTGLDGTPPTTPWTVGIWLLTTLEANCVASIPTKALKSITIEAGYWLDGISQSSSWSLYTPVSWSR